MRNICFVRRTFRFDGGAEVAASAYLTALSRISDVNLVCESWSGGHSDLTAIKVKRSGLTRGLKYKNFIVGCAAAVNNLGCIVHSHEWLPGSHVVRLGDGLHSDWLDIKQVSKAKRIFDGFHRQKLLFERHTLTHQNLKKVIVNSYYVGQSVIKRYGLPEDKVHLIRNIVTPRFLNHDPSKFERNNKKLLFVGSGWERKGLEVAIQAFSLLPTSWHFDVIGVDKKEKKYKKMAESLGVLGRINFLGAFPMTPDIYAKASVLIHPALYEPFPNVAIEALSQGVPVVSSYNSGTSDFDQSLGVWSVDSEPKKLADSIIYAGSVVEEDRASFRSHVCQFDKTYLESELQKVYLEITNT